MMEDDTRICEDIINSKNPFQCFNLPVEYTDPGVIRSRYLKIAVQIHPDKNQSPLATEAFQILSEWFEVLHNEDKQIEYLPSTGWKQNHRRKRKKKTKDVADLVHQNDKWYTKDWKDVEAEIERMTSEFKDHLAKRQERHERQQEKRAEKRQRKNKRIKKNLNYLYEKYGIDPSDSSSSSEEEKRNPYLVYSYGSDLAENNPQPSDQAQSSSSDPVSVVQAPQTSENKSTKPLLSTNENATVCWVCRRSFTSNELLQVHYAKSEMHRSNVEKADAEKARAEELKNNPWHKFKSSFSEVPD